MSTQFSFAKVGVYVDTANVYRSGGHRMRYDVLREFASRDGSEIIRLNAYASYDADRGRSDKVYASRVKKFYSVLRGFGYKIAIKEVKWYVDESGNRYGKANADLDLAVDMLLQSEKLDKVLLVSGDGDFTKAVNAVQNRGTRVEIIAMDNVSTDLRNEADVFISGYLIPDLVPMESGDGTGPTWGQPDSRVRGTCYFFNKAGGYGFMRYMRSIAPDIWITDTRREDSPYGTAYFSEANLPRGTNEIGRAHV